MTGAAEETRQYLLRRRAERLLTRRAEQLTAYAERLSARIEDLYDDDAEPSPALVAEFTAACRNAERAWLEAGITNVRETEPETP